MKGRIAQAGMTFIELMVVVAIVGILTTIALPNIKNYSARAKVSEAILAFGRCRNAVQEVYLSGGDTLPGENNWGCESGNTSKFVDSITTTDEGIIIVRLHPAVGDARIANADITMAPMNRSGTVMNSDDLGNSVYRWRCGSKSDKTDIDPNFLPGTCRGF
jgi:type IV pilus assembly protein PilA